MAMYLSFDASVKISKNGDWHSTKADKSGNKRSGKNGIVGMAHYLGRAEDLADGIAIDYKDDNHEALDLSRTKDNETMVKRGGKWERIEHSQEIADAIQERISWVDAHSDQPTRATGCVVRSIVVQFGNEDKPDLWAAAVEYLEGKLGADNIVCISIHRDETSPHMHVLFMPVAEAHKSEMVPVRDDAGNQLKDKKGEPKFRQVRGDVKTDEQGNPLYCFDQKAYFSGPKALASMHREFRAALIAKGYEVSAENKPIEEQLATWTDEDGKQHPVGLNPAAVGAIKEKIKQEARTEAEAITAAAHQEAAEIVEAGRVQGAVDLDDADQMAEKIRQEAEAEAQATRDAARKDAEATRTAAAAQAGKSKAQADKDRQEARNVLQGARAEAETIKAAAQAEAGAILDDARAEAAIMFERVSQTIYNGKLLSFLGEYQLKNGKTPLDYLEGWEKKFRELEKQRLGLDEQPRPKKRAGKVQPKQKEQPTQEAPAPKPKPSPQTVQQGPTLAELRAEISGFDWSAPLDEDERQK